MKQEEFDALDERAQEVQDALNSDGQEAAAEFIEELMALLHATVRPKRAKATTQEITMTDGRRVPVTPQAIMSMARAKGHAGNS